MDQKELLYQIGLTLLPNVGDVNAKNLVSYCGSASEVFKTKEKLLQKIPGIGEINAKRIVSNKNVLTRAEEELEFIAKYNIKPLFFTDEEYPQRLKFCNDSPVLLYYKGNANLNTEKIVAIVGTRKPDEYGIDITNKLLADLAGSGILVVSGLAYGIDVHAHKYALDNNLQTVGVVAHGLDRVYPGSHTALAKKMIKHGGLLTDFMSETNPDAVNFPKRNRIVAGLCDALIVVQSKREGGSLITATIAHSYNKDVFAFPGEAGSVLSEGCNGLIKRNRAGLIESAADLLDAMNWMQQEKKSKKKQVPLLISLSEDEQKIAQTFKQKKQLSLDEICYASEMSVSAVSTLLLQLEFSNLIKSKPGKVYEFLG
ncbi:MAG: DNA-protecting protein DprA [Sphingobacteriaceae bacterium]|nr:DNA-protecting protein DprA [Sphingobacteriaceae bacterium]